MILDTQIPPEAQDFFPIGELAKTVARDCIWRAYINNVLTFDEATKWVSEMGLQGE